MAYYTIATSYSIKIVYFWDYRGRLREPTFTTTSITVLLYVRHLCCYLRDTRITCCRLKTYQKKNLRDIFDMFQNQVFRWCKIYILFTKNVRNFHNQLQSIGIRQKCMVILRTLQRGREVLWNILFLYMIHDTYL